MSGVSRPRIVFCNRASRGAIRRRKSDPEPLVLDYRDDSKIRLGLPDFVRAADFNPSNVLYGLEGGGGIDNLHLRFLVTFNLTTGLGMLVGVLPVSDLDAMAFIPVTR